MDDKKLEAILREDHAPEIDVNARKRAVNLAMAEFKSAQSEKNKKTSQGFGWLYRLIGINKDIGDKNMEKKTKFIFGGAATAMALILVGSLSLSQLDETVDRFEKGQTAGASSAQLQAVQFKADGVATPVGSDVSSVPEAKDDDVAPAYIQAVEEQNEADLESAIAMGQSTIPVPIETPETRLNVPEREEVVKAEGGGDPLHQWRALQAERVTRDVAVQSADKNEVFADAIAPMPSAAPVIEQKKMKPARVEEQIQVTDDPLLKWRIKQQLRYEMENGNKFNEFVPNPFKQVTAEPVSTFSSDVDTASYSFVRKSLNNGRLPNPNSVRVEEMVNYFDYNYPLPESKSEPFKPTVTVVDSPWAEGRKLMHIGIKGYDVPKASLRSNLVFLLDVSGSMNQPDKLPLLKSSMKMLLDSLHPDDTVSIVTYAGHTGIALEPTKASNRSTIINAMDHLRAGGGTAGAAGIALAYDMAERNFNDEAVNRVILATDGDFNVGITNQNELKSYVEAKREKGIFLSVLGFGQGNYNDAMMQTLAQNGNGIAAYIDNLNEARKVLVEEATSSLFPIAKDVKFQVEFNPNAVQEYRLIGYETRALKREDFNNDKIDAGDMGAGHTVTAIYEFVPVGSNAVSVDPLRYGTKDENLKPAEPSDEYAFLKIRYKLPQETTSQLITTPVTLRENYHSYCPEGNTCKMRPISRDVRLSTAVAAFGQLLKGGQYTGDFSYDDVIALAQQGKGGDEFGYRAEFINLVRLAKTLSR